jgi:TolB protein
MQADDGGEKQRWLGLSQHIENPAWSPDGKWLVFTLYTYDAGAQLRYEDPDRNIRRFSEDDKDLPCYDPTWSPDGRWIAYAARQESTGTTDLWVRPSPLHPLYEEGWEPVRLTQMGMARGPTWSPDGTQIAFVASENGVFDLWLLNLDLSSTLPQAAEKPARLTNGGYVDATARPSWAP